MQANAEKGNLRHRADAVQKGNPHKLVINQHILPAESIRRFCNENGRLMVTRLDAGKLLKSVRPDDSCFVVRRVWDERTERGMPARIERRFQFLISQVLGGDLRRWAYEQNAIPEFFALWSTRAQCAAKPTADVQLKSVHPGRGMTKDVPERFEARFEIAADDQGFVAGRFFTGMRLQLQLKRLARTVENAGWRVINVEPGAGELVVPDRPFALYMPITPTIALVGGEGPKQLNRTVVMQLNRNALATSDRQIFARDFAACPL